MGCSQGGVGTQGVELGCSQGGVRTQGVELGCSQGGVLAWGWGYHSGGDCFMLLKFCSGMTRVEKCKQVRLEETGIQGLTLTDLGSQAKFDASASKF